MKFPMKNRAFAAAIFSFVVAAGCSPGGDPGDPNVGAAPGPPASSLGMQSRPGTPGGPALKAPPPADPYGGRSGAAAGR